VVIAVTVLLGLGSSRHTCARLAYRAGTVKATASPEIRACSRLREKLAVSIVLASVIG